MTGVALADSPSETVRGSAAVVELDRCPHCFEPGGAEKFFCLQGLIPLGNIFDREIKTAVGGSVHRWRHPFLVLQNAILECVARSTIGNDVGFIDNASALHVERTEYSLLKKL